MRAISASLILIWLAMAAASQMPYFAKSASVQRASNARAPSPAGGLDGASPLYIAETVRVLPPLPRTISFFEPHAPRPSLREMRVATGLAPPPQLLG